MLFYALTIVLYLFLIALVFLGPDANRGFFFAAAISATYYCILAPLYWLSTASGTFLEVDWSDVLPQATLTIAAGLALVSIVVRLSLRLPTSTEEGGKLIAYGDTTTTSLESKRLVQFGVLGSVGAGYVLLRSSTSGLPVQDPFLLIAYQFSDICIPILVYIVARSGFSRTNIALLSLFVFYAVIVGFRYKLVLLAYPILFGLFTSQTSNQPNRLFSTNRVVAFCLAGFTTALFVVMTIARRKFSGLDTDSLRTADRQDFLYGLFAESNILFGLSGVLTDFGVRVDYQYLTPIRDAFLELIPRFLMPDRLTGEYLEYAAQSLVSNEAILSGTAYPFVGEFFIMWGYPGIVIGCIATGWMVSQLGNYILSRTPVHSPIGASGLGLVGIMFGYYFVSRGYLPQALKGLLFTVIPYLMVLNVREKRTK